MESTLEDGISFAQRLSPKIVYSIKDDAVPITGSERTAYRRLDTLAAFGIANLHDGYFEINRVVRQPAYIFQKLLPSLTALKNARRFGRFYNDYDANFLFKNVLENSMITLDYKAWELTRFQIPSDLFIYVDDVASFTDHLKQNKFSEGKNGHIAVLPKIGNFENEIERVYLDCIARGGRSTLDAIAIELLYGDKLSVKGQFPVEYVLKVHEDMPREMLPLETVS